MSRYCIFVVLLFMLLTSGCERAKTKLDREVDRLCAIDGGVKIYEKVTLAPENFGPNGEVFPQYQHLTSKGGQLGPEYLSELVSTELVSGSPNLTRWRSTVVRLSDSKLIGISITYVRRGGDFYSLSPDSVYSCPLPVASNLIPKIFIRSTK